MSKQEIKLSDEITSRLLAYGEPILNKWPVGVVLASTRFFVMPGPLEKFYQVVKASIWGGCFKKNEVVVDKDYLEPMRMEPWRFCDELFHELWHNGQRWEDGDFKFSLKYAWGMIIHFGKWKEIKYEREAFAAQARFAKRMAEG